MFWFQQTVITCSSENMLTLYVIASAKCLVSTRAIKQLSFFRFQAVIRRFDVMRRCTAVKEWWSALTWMGQRLPSVSAPKDVLAIDASCVRIKNRWEFGSKMHTGICFAPLGDTSHSLTVGPWSRFLPTVLNPSRVARVSIRLHVSVWSFRPRYRAM